MHEKLYKNLFFSIYAHFTETMEVVENLFLKKLMVNNSFIEKTCKSCRYSLELPLCGNSNVPTTNVTENKENYFEIYTYLKVSCPLSLPL